MFFEVELQRDVKIHGRNLDINRPFSKSFILACLLDDLLKEKASEDHGYFLAVTSLKSVSKGNATDDSGNMVFSVVFTCRTFKPLEGEILQGVVRWINARGVFLRCGPIWNTYLSCRKMSNYQYVPDVKPSFLSNGLSKIEEGVVVCFLVLGVRWINGRRDFEMLASVEADSLGPVSLPGFDESEL